MMHQRPPRASRIVATAMAVGLAAASACGDGTHVDLLERARADAATPVEHDATPAPDAADAADPRPCPPNATVTPPMTLLLDDAVGFGSAAAASAAQCVVHVTTLDDDGPGSLRVAAATEAGAAWIVFDVGGEITLASNIVVGSNKTIDGRGRVVTLRGFGLVAEGVSNVVIENLRFIGNNIGTSNDGVHIAYAARNIWIDHCSFSAYGDEAIGISRGATDVTVSWTLILGPNNGVLIGRSTDDTEDVDIRVTLHHNWWNMVNNYAPRMRYGKVHLFNNLIDRWLSGAAAVTMGGQLASENNVFVASTNTTAMATHAGTDGAAGYIRSTGDLFENRASAGTDAVDAGAAVFEPSASYRYVATAASALAVDVRAGAGAR